MKEFEYRLTDPDGIHARPAGLLVKEASKYNAVISVKKGEAKADAKRIFGLMGLGAKKGDTVTVSFQGEQEEEAFVAIKTFFEENL